MHLTDILSACSDLEARIAKIYRKVAETSEPSGDRARLWLDLALEDEMHADLLLRERRSFEKRNKTGGNAPEFALRLAKAQECLEKLEARSTQLTMTREEATDLAIAVEQVNLDDLYDDLAAHGPPAFRLVCARVEAALSARPVGPLRSPPKSRRGRIVSATRGD